jgi:hypothetical protein
MQNTETERITAIHEAGHAVIHHLCGHRVEFVNICLTGKDSDYGHGCTRVVLQWPHQAILGIFAGPWAQTLFSDDPPIMRGYEDDHREIDHQLRLLKLDDSQRAELRADLKKKSRALVEENEKNIRTVADFLLEHGCIGKPDDGGTEATETLKRLIRTNLA